MNSEALPAHPLCIPTSVMPTSSQPWCHCLAWVWLGA